MGFASVYGEYVGLRMYVKSVPTIVSITDQTGLIHISSTGANDWSCIQRVRGQKTDAKKADSKKLNSNRLRPPIIRN